MAILLIDGVTMPSPSALSVALEEIGDDAGRNILGERVVDRVAVKRAVELHWAQLSSAALQLLMEAAAPIFFTAHYPDPATGAMRAGVFRAAEKRARVFRADGGAPAWAEVRMKWEER